MGPARGAPATQGPWLGRGRPSLPPPRSCPSKPAWAGDSADQVAGDGKGPRTGHPHAEVPCAWGSLGSGHVLPKRGECSKGQVSEVTCYVHFLVTHVLSTSGTPLSSRGDKCKVAKRQRLPRAVTVSEGAAGTLRGDCPSLGWEAPGETPVGKGLSPG